MAAVDVAVVCREDVVVVTDSDANPKVSLFCAVLANSMGMAESLVSWLHASHRFLVGVLMQPCALLEPCMSLCAGVNCTRHNFLHAS